MAINGHIWPSTTITTNTSTTSASFPQVLVSDKILQPSVKLKARHQSIGNGLSSSANCNDDSYFRWFSENTFCDIFPRGFCKATGSKYEFTKVQTVKNVKCKTTGFSELSSCLMKYPVLHRGPSKPIPLQPSKSYLLIHQKYLFLRFYIEGQPIRLRLLSKDRQSLLKLISFDFLVVCMQVGWAENAGVWGA